VDPSLRDVARWFIASPWRPPIARLLNVTDPSLEKVKHHPEAHTYALLLVALVEHGGPMTLADVAARFDAAGIAPADEALASLRRCRPARAPIYREGDTYCLDPHDKDADLWMFRLGLRPAEVSRTEVVRPAPPPLPGPDVPPHPSQSSTRRGRAPPP
jgi:hypothetical protein